jgi:hypothetical protein
MLAYASDPEQENKITQNLVQVYSFGSLDYIPPWPPFVFVTVVVVGVQVFTPPPAVEDEPPPYVGGGLPPGRAETMLLKPSKATKAALKEVCILTQ